MKRITLILTFILLSTSPILACDCECTGDCSFSVIFSNREFGALIRVLSYDDYLESDIMGYEGKMPYSMKVEIIKKYKGTENRKILKIWGDNGRECRPYIANFKIGEYYLIAPRLLGANSLPNENPNDYEFFSCVTDYLKVDNNKGIAIGEYSKGVNELTIADFEQQVILSLYTQMGSEIIEIPYSEVKITVENSTISGFFNQYFPDIELHNYHTYSTIPTGRTLYIKYGDKLYHTYNELNDFINDYVNQDSTEYEPEILMKLYVLLKYIGTHPSDIISNDVNINLKTSRIEEQYNGVVPKYIENSKFKDFDLNHEITVTLDSKYKVTVLHYKFNIKCGTIISVVGRGVRDLEDRFRLYIDIDHFDPEKYKNCN